MSKKKDHSINFYNSELKTGRVRRCAKYEDICSHFMFPLPYFTFQYRTEALMKLSKKNLVKLLLLKCGNFELEIVALNQYLLQSHISNMSISAGYLCRLTSECNNECNNESRYWYYNRAAKIFERLNQVYKIFFSAFRS